MQRFLLETDILEQEEIILKDEEIIYQLIKVLRAKPTDQVIFFDGQTFCDYIYEIKSIDKKNIIFSFISKQEKKEEFKGLSLYQSLPNKIDKIEDIIQKWTEIWYSHFYFFRSERSQDIYISENKILRFKKIIQEAVEQSWRNIIPQLHFLDNLDILNIKWQNIFFHTDVELSQKLSDISFDFSSEINIFVGPEWGFSPKENDIFLQNNFMKVYLGNNILRTQTTWIVVWFHILQNNTK